MKIKLKENRGITLVALIITIIIMLILAGVAISVLTDDAGLFDKTRNAVLAYEESAQNEADEMQKWMNEIDMYLSGGPVQNSAPTEVTLDVSDITENSFTLVATGKDKTGIAKYEFYVNGVLEKTEEISAETVTFNVTGKTASTEYKCKVKVYNTVGKFKESSEIIVTTENPFHVEPDTVAKVGDFVNYSVEVDGVTYDKWRILYLDNNGHMEIVCYNGPDFTLGEHTNVTKGKSDYANAIKILNDESAAYKNGIYGYNARHLGSNPSNPSSYATISTSYVEFYSDSTILTERRAYLSQTHYESDLASVKSFSDTVDGKKLEDWAWLASRDMIQGSRDSNFYINGVTYNGNKSGGRCIYNVNSDGSAMGYGAVQALAPVVSLESGVKINTSLEGNGSEESPWQLTK